MRRWTYLNVILTINAALLTILLLVQVISGPSLASTVHAAAPKVQSHGAVGIPNAGEQRIEIIRQLRSLNEKVEKTNKRIAEGEVRVSVSNISELRAAVGTDRD